MQAHLGRAEGDVEHCRDLRVGESFDLLEHEHGAEVGRERSERLLDSECRLRRIDARVSAPFIQLYDWPRTLLAQPHEGDTRGDLPEPGAKRSAFLVAAECFGKSDEDVVHDVFRVLSALQQPVREGEEFPRVA